MSHIQLPPGVPGIRGLLVAYPETAGPLMALARTDGATDREIHDTVLMAACFSLFNRYVDGLGAPEGDPNDDEVLGERLVRSGYA